MTDQVRIRRALISVSDKTDLVPFAKGLAEQGVVLISTGGTADALRAAGLDVIGVESVTGLPEMMGGRVKTLHPSIHGGILARRDVPEHVDAMNQHNIDPIDLVCINLYPFEQTIQRDEVTVDEAIEQIDIGGPALLRSSAKNHDFITVVTSAGQYDRVIREMRQNEGCTTVGLRRELAAAAFTRTAEYDTTISAWMGQRIGMRSGNFPEMLQLSFAKVEDLRYGENPHQKAAVYTDPASAMTSIVSAELLHGKPLSYNNLLDGAAALELVQSLAEINGGAAAAIIKHTNPCGAAIAETPVEALERACAGDPLAAYGGILAMSTAIDSSLAGQIASDGRFLEVIIAPSFDDDAVSTLGDRWANVRLLSVGPLGGTSERIFDQRSVPGGILIQERDNRPANPGTWTHVAGPPADDAMIEDAAFLWTIVKHLKSNAIAIGAARQLLGGGPGQVDRVGSCRIAIAKAGDRMTAFRDAGQAVVAASDAFFPFPDGPELLINAGVNCIVHPGGSKRDTETFEVCDQHEVTCLVTGVRHFKH